ncbi:MAG: ATP-dependent helicase UvrD/PcrA, partial [Thermoleophilaceae bacterium]|nr:ATP-dependent helicase UvrD/PcrA [Thermoleophilaceae bacterium]
MPDPVDGLNAAQLEAVTHPGGPLLIVGGAGSGKTSTLIERFAWLVEQGTPPEAILALTFSPAAADGLRDRLEARVEDAHEELRVGAFRTLCERLLRDEALEAGLDPFFACVTPADRLALLLERLEELTLRRHEIRGNPAPLIASFVTRIDRLKDELIEARDYVAYAQRLSAGATSDAERAHAGRELEFARVYADHDALLAERGALDFGDLALHAFRLLHEKPHVRERLASRHRHLLVDEFQEAGFAQGLVLRMLAQSHRNLAAAADDDQAIHRLRGAWRKNITDFTLEYTDAKVVRLERSYRGGRRIIAAAQAVLENGAGDREPKQLRARGMGRVRYWRCRSERAQAQAVAADVERLLTQDGVAAEQVAVLVRSVRDDGQVVASALEERAIPFRLTGSAAYFQRSEVRDVLAWLRLLADPGDSGAVVRALSRPPIEIRSVDIARLTQIARRRRLDMVSGVQAAIESPQLSPEGRDRALTFLRIHKAAARAYDEMRPEAFVHRLIEWIGLRRRQVFAAQADTIERLVNIMKLADLAVAYVRREPDATTRDFSRYVAAVAEAGLREEEATAPTLPSAVRVMSMHAAKGCEFEHVFVLGLSAAKVPGPRRPDSAAVPEALIKESPQVAQSPAAVHEGEVRRLVHMAMTRARRGLVLAWPESADGGAPARPSSLFEEARAATGGEEELHEEQLFGPAEGLHSTFRMMRDELLDSVSDVGGRLSEMRLDTYLDVSGSVVRHLELLKLAALIERAKQGQSVADALPEVNDLLSQAATPDQRELFRASALDDYLRDAERDERRRAAAIAAGADQSLEPFIPRRGDGLMLSASDIETYRLCPLKYKFARVFRIPQEPSINQRFGIALHQVLERYHATGGGSLEQLMQLFESSWRRCGFGDGNDDLQYRRRAIAALRRYWDLDRERSGELVSVERSFAFKIGPHLLRGRVDRVDRLADGTHELIDYKTGKP